MVIGLALERAGLGWKGMGRKGQSYHHTMGVTLEDSPNIYYTTFFLAVHS